MSGESDPAAPPTPGKAPPASMGVVIISIASLSLMAAALGVAAWLHNESAIMLITGAVISNATTIVQWWVGSSKGSADKAIALQAAAAAAALPFGLEPSTKSVG